MEKQISIIIPTYNMEKYIGKCLDSLLIPEFDQVEVLVINDGSKDRSSEITHEYADRYPSSIKVIDKPNGNYGSCINTALPLCTGRYVKILDADDTFDTPAFSEFVRKLPECQEDVVLSKFAEISDKNEIIKIHDFKDWKIEFEKPYNISDAEKRFLYRFIDMHHITYSTTVFKKFIYRQTEGISYTDTEWAIIPLSYCERIVFVNLPIYKYLIGRDGQTMSSEQIIKNANNFFIILQRLVKEYSAVKEDTIQKKLLWHHIRNRHKYVYLTVMSARDPKGITILKEYDESLKDSSFTFYKAIGEINLDPKFRYRIFEKFRKSNYSINFRIPFWVKLLISIDSKLNAK